jgi:hypothetical protein
MVGIASAATIRSYTINSLVCHCRENGFKTAGHMVQDVEGIEFSNFNFFVHCPLHLVNLFSHSHHNIGVSQEGPKFKHMALVV